MTFCLPALALAALFCLQACSPPQEGNAILGVGPLSVFAVGPSDLLPTTRLEIEGSGFLPEGSGSHTLWLTNSLGLNVLVEGNLDADNKLSAPLGEALNAITQPGVYLGPCTLRITRTSALDGSSSWVEVPMEFTFNEQLVPVVAAVSGPEWYPGDSVIIEGSGFLRPEEGTLQARFSGTLLQGAPEVNVEVASQVFVLEPISRTQAILPLTPDVIGILPSSLSGEFVLENVPLGGSIGTSPPFAIGPITYNRPILNQVAPDVVRRGQTLIFDGRGFLPTTPEIQASSLILLEGILTSSSGEVLSYEGDNVLPLFPDSFEGNVRMNYILRVNQNIDGELEGLGLIPGVFTGQAFPWILNGKDTVLGDGMNVKLVIAPQLQVVHLKYLPGYYTALERFGLLNAADWVNQRIMQVVHRDYAGINVAFTEEVPAEFAEYGVVEIGGEDPNGANLFGLDNTEGKDVGNIRFNDIIGGVNAETAEEGYYAYGGIFVASFLGLSATLGQGDLPITDPRFDMVFGPFSPELGGVPATAEELYQGERAGALAEAIRILGNLIGNTVTHEVGHSLGLTSIDGQFHNVGDNEGWIMDAGIHRPFAERAELDGIPPAVFSPFNREYLEAVLPTQ